MSRKNLLDLLKGIIYFYNIKVLKFKPPFNPNKIWHQVSIHVILAKV